MATQWKLRPHQVEAVDAVVRALAQVPAEGSPGGVRAQVVAATGTGKSLIAVHVARALRAQRVLVLVPTLGLLAQTASVWREAGRRGPMFGACSLSGEDAQILQCTTDEAELVGWVSGLESVTVFATYASLGLGVLERSHRAGLGAWDLVVVDEAHRTSGALGKAWAGVHDDGRVPALRRLYMTATPRLWEVPDREGPERGGELVASMDDEAVFGPVVYRLSLSEAIERGLIARYQVVCVDIADPGLPVTELAGGAGRTARVRGARLAALQTAVVKAAAERRLRRLLTFHYRTGEAEAFSSGLGGVAKELHESDPGLYPGADGVWADWLCGEHKPGHRSLVLEEFASEPEVGPGAAWVRVLSSVRVLGEGVDTKECDAVVFADVRGSAVDIVQAVGRALRMQPGEGKVASLVVPVFLGPGEQPDEMLVSRAYGELVKVLTALRAHDAQAVEQLAAPQVAGGQSGGGMVDVPGEVGKVAAELLSFSRPRDPAQLAAFISLRVLQPERQFWRRGLAAALAYRSDHGDLAVPYEYRTADGFALGVWIARQRSAHTRGELSEERVGQLEELGMIWSHAEVAFAEGLSAARGWAQEHGHLLAPADAMWEGYAVGVWLKNQRAAARQGEDGQGAGGLSTARRQALEDIDPSWCPSWSVAWQRCFHLARLHVQGGQALPQVSGQVVVQGDDLGQWASRQRRQWDSLGAAQQWLLRETLGLGPVQEREQGVVAPRRTRAEVWAANLAAVRQYQEREGHLEVPHRHIEKVGRDEHALGVFIANSRSRRTRLAPERVAELTELGMRWE
ncbi:DEAD/DEAH box helicase [Streptomyces sp. NRRL S-1813]|uniref:DEAD/DEAH box helicase n=1 Tax=Streptomyces sp. NRRL S-1813 TaxID=1463888 RepID=UPI0004C83447|nr:DEAD/DEAH box helicase [Streptomyces sp. NRRL S-1813]